MSLGSGDHQRIGSFALYHGNIPERYANIRREGERSPPKATIPSSDV
jgi:hypothetical protein